MQSHTDAIIKTTDSGTAELPESAMYPQNSPEREGQSFWQKIRSFLNF